MSMAGRLQWQLSGSVEALGYSQGLTGMQLPTYHKHKGSAWLRMAAREAQVLKAGSPLNYLIHNRLHCIHLSRTRALLSSIIEALDKLVQVGEESCPLEC